MQSVKSLYDAIERNFFDTLTKKLSSLFLLVLVSAFGAIRTRLAEGSKSAVNGALLAAMNTASEYGFGAVIASLPGFLVLADWLKQIPNPLVNQAVNAFKAHLPDSAPVNLVTDKNTNEVSKKTVKLTKDGQTFQDSAVGDGPLPDELRLLADMGLLLRQEVGRQVQEIGIK